MGSPVKTVPVLLFFSHRVDTKENSGKSLNPYIYVFARKKKKKMWIVILVDFFCF